MIRLVKGYVKYVFESDKMDSYWRLVYREAVRSRRSKIVELVIGIKNSFGVEFTSVIGEGTIKDTNTWLTPNLLPTIFNAHANLLFCAETVGAFVGRTERQSELQAVFAEFGQKDFTTNYLAFGSYLSGLLSDDNIEKFEEIHKTRERPFKPPPELNIGHSRTSVEFYLRHISPVYFCNRFKYIFFEFLSEASTNDLVWLMVMVAEWKLWNLHG